jgi:acyl phosphate:glycerol-3-phosphate acyltransferase
MTSLPGFLLIGYLFGSLPFAVIVSRLFGLADPRSFGSGNPGATNVLRSGNKVAALLTLLGDALKGWAAVATVTALGGDSLAIATSGLAAFLGHLYSVFLRFKGGKGVATALGVLTGYHPALALLAMATWLAVALVTRYSSAAALAAAAEAPVAVWLFSTRADLTVCAAIMCGLLFWRHRANIRRLMAGTESRIGARKAS